MKKYIVPAIVEFCSMAIIASICWALYTIASLDEIFGVYISPIQWLAITVICTLLFTRPNKKEDDAKGS